LISGFPRDVDLICGLLGDYTASWGNYLPTFRESVSVPSSRVEISFVESRHVKMGPTRCPETSVNNYLTTPCNHPKDHRLNQHRGGSLKSNLKLSPPWAVVEIQTSALLKG
jgi:hypothetical protein